MLSTSRSSLSFLLWFIDKIKDIQNIISAWLSAELMPWRGHPSSVCRPSVISETIKRINANFMKRYLSTIFPDHFPLFQNFWIFDFFLPFFFHFPVMVLAKLLIGIFQISFKKKQIEMFVNMGPNRSENVKTLLLQLWFFCDQTFSECSLAVTVPKRCLLGFWYFKFQFVFERKAWSFLGKWKIANILEMALS